VAVAQARPQLRQIPTRRLRWRRRRAAVVAVAAEAAVPPRAPGRIA